MPSQRFKGFPKHVIFMSKCLEVLTGGRSMPGKCLRDVALGQLAGCEMGLTLESEEGEVPHLRWSQAPPLPWPRPGSADMSKSSGKGFGQRRNVFVSETVEQKEDTPEDGETSQLDAIPEDIEQSNEVFDDDAAPENAEGDDDVQSDDGAGRIIGELSQVLTITAKKLAGVTLGRKFTTTRPKSSPGGKPSSKSIEERKRNSHCAVCGEKGHWQGDDECRVSKGSSRASTYRSPPSQKSASQPTLGHGGQLQQPKQSYVVNHKDGSFEIQDQGEQFGNLFKCMVTFAVHEVKNGGPQSFAGLMIRDSACQRTCCGSTWLEAHCEKLQQDHKVRPYRVKCSEMFQFGKGSPSEAHERVYIPSAIAGVSMLVGSAVLQEDIPLLASNTFMQHMGATISMTTNMVHLSALEFQQHFITFMDIWRLIFWIFFMEKIKKQFGKSFHIHGFGKTHIQNVSSQSFCILKCLVKSRL